MSERKPINKKALGIVGSPRRGNTEVLVDEVLAGAEEVGALTEKVLLNDLTIAPCHACNACQKTGKCKHQDDMITLKEQLISSELWVLGTPVYWWGPTAQFKTFIDRWYGFKRDIFDGKYAILAIPFGGGHKHYARHLVGMITDILSYLNINLIETVLAPGVGARGEVQDNTTVLRAAHLAGRKAIELLDR